MPHNVPPLQAAVLREARDAYAAGLCIVPTAEDGSKRPMPNALGTWGDYQKRQSTPEELRGWYPGRTGLGIICGPVSGHVANLDFDDEPTYLAYVDLARASGLGDLIDRIEAGYCDDTPANGVRWLVRYPAEFDWPFGHLAARPKRTKDESDTTLIETTLHTIVAPTGGTVHPSGKPYVRRSGSFKTIATLTTEDVHALLHLARAFDEMPKAPRERPAPAAPAGDGRPGDDFIARTTWADVLTPHGWVDVYQRGDTTCWRRPGKTRGISATTNHGGTDRLHVFSSSTPFDPGGGYSRFSAYAILNHAGDFKAAASALARDGYGTAKAPSSTASSAPTTDVEATGPDDLALDLGRLTDAHAAELVARREGDRLRFDQERNDWRQWDGIAWRADHVGARQAAVVRLAHAIARFALSLSDLEARKRVLAFGLKLESRHGCDNCLELAKHRPPLAVTSGVWDRDPWLLNTPSGIVDLHTGLVRPARPDDLCQLVTRAAFDPTATAPRFLRFLNELFPDDAPLQAYVQRFAGYCLTGATIEQVFLLLLGVGANGKSVLLAVLGSVLGSYAYTAPFATFLRQRQEGGNVASPELAALAGRRLITALESCEASRLDEGRIKSLTGGDVITARHLYGRHFSFEPVGKIVLAANHRPRVSDDSLAFWRRCHVVPFLESFTGERADQHLIDILQAEAGGILNWMIAGCLTWQRDGLQPPAAVQLASDTYRKANDPMAAFLADCTTEGGFDDTVLVREVFAVYLTWAEKEGIADRDRLKRRAFGERLEERFGGFHCNQGTAVRHLKLKGTL
jgi:putative DNA primase/helicase